nr:CPBP family intramembrane metalloprotease [Anaerolineae bacterium]
MRAIGGIGLAYGLLLAVLLIANALGGQFQIFRQSYYGVAILDNWLLTGLGEEFFFAGVLFTLVQKRIRRAWLAVLLTAIAFALWHLPGYLAIGLRTGDLGAGILFDLMLNLLSWSFFGTIYYLSGNLWLTAFAHASTDYGLLPAITDAPALGLLFMLG